MAGHRPGAVSMNWAAVARLRTETPDRPKLTDGGNLTIDCSFEKTADPAHYATEIRRLVSVIESGLFVGMATEIFIASELGVRVATLADSGSRFR